MEVLSEIPQVDQILAPYRDDVGHVFRGYRNHVCRMLNYCFQLHDCDDEARQKLIIAGCFHDLGLWPSQDIDYLEPSIEMAIEYLDSAGQSQWSDEISRMIDLHHKIRRVKNDPSPLVEVFRRADLVDVTFGAVRFGVSRSIVKKVSANYPNHGFHKALVRMATKRLITKPWSPLPMAR